MNNRKQAIRCRNYKVHKENKGRLLAVFDGNCIYIHCKNSLCKRWTRIKVQFEGIDLDFSKAAIIQDTLPEGCFFNLESAGAIVGDDYECS